jgi:hypothetical protein
MLATAAAESTEREAAPRPAESDGMSVTDWLCSALLGRPWQFLTGVDLLPARNSLLEEKPSVDPEAGDVSTEGSTTGPVLYVADGQHGMSGYHVKTVGNAPVAVPQPLTAGERASAEASAKAATTGSAWNAEGGTWETRDTTAWATMRLPALCDIHAGSIIKQVKVVGGDASVAVVRG